MKAFICSLSPCRGLGEHLLTPRADESHKGGRQQGCSEQCVRTAGGSLGCWSYNHHCCNSSAWKRKGERAVRSSLQCHVCGAALQEPSSGVPVPVFATQWGQHRSRTRSQGWMHTVSRKQNHFPVPIPTPAAVAQQLAPTRFAFVYSNAFHHVAG